MAAAVVVVGALCRLRRGLGRGWRMWGPLQGVDQLQGPLLPLPPLLVLPESLFSLVLDIGPWVAP